MRRLDRSLGGGAVTVATHDWLGWVLRVGGVPDRQVTEQEA
jgi:hypothetical protein